MKLNNNLLVLCALSSTLTFTSCEKYDELFPEQYHCVLNIKNAGISTVQLYTTNTEATVPVSVMKTGSEAKISSTGLLSSMTREVYNEYTQNNDIHYEFLPSDYYTLKNNELSFSETERYKLVDIVFKTREIKQLMDNNSGKSYALPLLLTSGEATVNDSVLIVSPNVLAPTIGFNTSGFVSFANFTTTGDASVEKTLDVVIPLQDEWGLQCSVISDDEAKEKFNQFNSNNDNRYRLLPEEAYTLSDNGVVTFAKGAASASLNIKINRSELSVGEYILPLSVANPTIEGFDIDNLNNIVLLGVTYSPDKIELKESQLSANSIHPGDGTGLKGLIDGIGTGKHFHSNYSSTVMNPTYGNYIDIKLESAIKSVKFDYWTRFDNGNGAPTHIKIFVSSDNSSWTELGDIKSGLPGGGNQKYSSKIYESDKEFKYFRFAVLQSAAGDMTTGAGSFFNLGELILYGN